MADLDRPAEHWGESMSGSRLRPYLGPVVALLVVLALGAGTVYAAIPNGSGSTTPASRQAPVSVRLINYPKQKCTAGERLINWSQQGPAGPAGAQGPQGVPGPKGRRPGPKGDPGPADWNAIPSEPRACDGAAGPAGAAAITLTREVGQVLGTASMPARTSTVVVGCSAGSMVVGGGASAPAVTTSSLELVALDGGHLEGRRHQPHRRGLWRPPLCRASCARPPPRPSPRPRRACCLPR